MPSPQSTCSSTYLRILGQPRFHGDILCAGGALDDGTLCTAFNCSCCPWDLRTPSCISRAVRSRQWHRNRNVNVHVVARTSLSSKLTVDQAGKEPTRVVVGPGGRGRIASSRPPATSHSQSTKSPTSGRQHHELRWYPHEFQESQPRRAPPGRRKSRCCPSCEFLRVLPPVTLTFLTTYDRYQDEKNDVETEPDITTWSFPTPEVSTIFDRMLLSSVPAELSKQESFLRVP